jgi:dihydrolipoamide dehydrogenase
MTRRVAILGGGPAGNTCATYAARYGAEVVLVERDVIGGAAHLWDCIPSKAMIATGGAMSFLARSQGMGLETVRPEIDRHALEERVGTIEGKIKSAITGLLADQRVRMVEGSGRLLAPTAVQITSAAGTETVEVDAVVLATGTRPRIPQWCHPDGDRVLTTRDAYPPKEMPSHLIVVGSGVTGVEFVHMFTSLNSEVTLVVSRQQVLPQKDPEVAAALEETFLKRGVRLLKGARAEAIERDGDVVTVSCDDGRVTRGSHALLAIGSVPNSDGLGLAEAGVQVDDAGYVVVDHNLQSTQTGIYAAGDLSGKLPLSSVASMQGRKIAEHIMGMHQSRPHRHLDYDKAASAIFTEPEIADVGLAEADAFASGRKIRVTKVPFSVAPKALINDDTRGFVKLLSDPATGVILGGSIVGRHAAELISVIAVAVTNHLTVTDLAESLMVHPTLAEVLTEASECTAEVVAEAPV